MVLYVRNSSISAKPYTAHEESSTVIMAYTVEGRKWLIYGNNYTREICTQHEKQGLEEICSELKDKLFATHVLKPFTVHMPTTAPYRELQALTLFQQTGKISTLC